jgi:uncharacterized protein YecE (DUF72 family)
MTANPDDTPSLFGDAFPIADARPPAQQTRGPLELTPNAESLRELGASLPANFYLGTSSWSFPGWNGLVYDRDASESNLAREGLAAYARHPLFRSVGLDKTYYRPAPRAEFERLASQVPDDFRFLVKMWRGLVEQGVRGSAELSGSLDGFLNARVAEVECVIPTIEGLGEKAGPLLFQFPPIRFGGVRAQRSFLSQLSQFLAALPKGPLYAVEVRNRTLLSPECGPRFAALLAENNAVPCLAVHPTMPSLDIQARELVLDHTKPRVIRWMLRSNHAYAEAKDLYEPFDALLEPDDASLDAIARLARAALTAGLGTWVIVNNKAEGSSPLSVERVARAVVRDALHIPPPPQSLTDTVPNS